jgi:hypothetical protein
MHRSYPTSTAASKRRLVGPVCDEPHHAVRLVNLCGWHIRFTFQVVLAASAARNGPHVSQSNPEPPLCHRRSADTQ